MDNITRNFTAKFYDANGAEIYAASFVAPMFGIRFTFTARKLAAKAKVDYAWMRIFIDGRQVSEGK